MNSITFTRKTCKIVQVMIYDKKMKKKIKIYTDVVTLKPMVSILTTIRSIQRAKRDSDGYRIRKYITLNQYFS